MRAKPGMSIIEIMAATVVLGVLATLVVQLFAAVGRQQRTVDHRALAIESAANVLEQFTAQPYDALTEAAAAQLTLPDTTRAALPGAKLTVSVAEQSGTPVGKRISVQLAWRDAAGVSVAPVRLATWSYESARARP